MRWIAESLRSLKIGTDLNRSARESEVTCGSYHGAVLHDEMWCGDRANTDKMIDTLDAVVWLHSARRVRNSGRIKAALTCTGATLASGPGKRS